MTVQIPLYALFAKPISVQIDTIILVLSTRPPNQWNAEEFKKFYIFMKKKSLASGEAAAYMNTLENGFLWRLGMRLGKNVKVQVKNIHIRFEDRIARRNRGIAIGNG